MAIRLHDSARTTPRIRAELQLATGSHRSLAKLYGINLKTVAKWRARTSVLDESMGPRCRASQHLSQEQEHLASALRNKGHLFLDDLMGHLRETAPKLTDTCIGHIFERICKFNGIEKRHTKPYPPWTNGMVERMNRTIKESTIKAYEYEGPEQLREHVQALVQSYNFGKHLKTLRWKTPFRAMCEAWEKNQASLDFICTTSPWD